MSAPRTTPPSHPAPGSTPGAETEDRSLTRAAAYAAASVLAAGGGVHLYWTLRGTWGAATAYGSTDLPPRGAVAAVTALIAAAALLLLARVGALAVPLPSAVLRWGSWLLVGAFALVGIANLTAPADSYAREWHVFFFGPLLLILAGLCAVVARSPLPHGDA